MRRLFPFLVICALWSVAALRDGLDQWVDSTMLPPLLAETSVEVRGQDGALLRVFPVEDGRVRLDVRLDQVDRKFLDLLIGYEDKRFYDHVGVDPLALLRAGGQAVISGKIVSGGSTLTMQVARLLENSGTGRWQGKLRQIRVALALERRLSKADILKLYLLHAPYGGNLEGIRAATLAWFGKEPARLTMAEAALLVALPQAPENRRPDVNPAAAEAARRRVLQRAGVGYPDRIAAVPGQMRPLVRLAPHLADRVRAADPMAQRLDLTIDAALQHEMEVLARRAVSGQPADVSAAIIVADHTTGAIRASVGAPRYSAANGAQGFVDMTRAMRSPGSTLKPFVYGMAFDDGLGHPQTIINDGPVQIGRYAPQNFDGVFRGEVTLRRALQESLNIPPILLLEELGPVRLMALIKTAGAEARLPGHTPGLAVVLGGVGLRLEGLVTMYAGLANGGIARPLHWRQMEKGDPGKRFMSRAAAWQVGQILAQTPPPVGMAARTGEIAFKTGTSYGHRDAWAIGYDGAHVIGIWLGRPTGAPVPGAFGGDLAAPILFEAFGRVPGGKQPLPPPPPETLIVETAALPHALQRFRARDAVFSAPKNAPRVTFPPNGAVVQRSEVGLALKLAQGSLPLTVLLNGAPVATGLMRRELVLPITEPGFADIAVIDAKGLSDRVAIQLD